MAPIVRGKGFEERARWAALALFALALVLRLVPAGAAPAKINGTGSTSVGFAMQQWVHDAQQAGLQISYLPTGSTAGVSQYFDNLVDFAVTELPPAALLPLAELDRSYQLVPIAAGATAVMYHVQTEGGAAVTDLRLRNSTLAGIFTGSIARWSDPAITADNGGRVLPDQPITVVYRGGSSSTTAHLYDYIRHIAPTRFAAWANFNHLPTAGPLTELDGAPSFAPRTQALNGSDQMAQFVASSNGLWSISYAELPYTLTYRNQVAAVENESHAFVVPTATGIFTALMGTVPTSDGSHDLSVAYKGHAPSQYPLSSYSYLVTACATTSLLQTCTDPYTNRGVIETLKQWMRYIACEGQQSMASIGYAPLPTMAAQEVGYAIGRLDGVMPEVFTPATCANPTFAGAMEPPSSTTTASTATSTSVSTSTSSTTSSTPMTSTTVAPTSTSTSSTTSTTKVGGTTTTSNPPGTTSSTAAASAAPTSTARAPDPLPKTGVGSLRAAASSLLLAAAGALFLLSADQRRRRFG